MSKHRSLQARKGADPEACVRRRRPGPRHVRAFYETATITYSTFAPFFKPAGAGRIMCLDRCRDPRKRGERRELSQARPSSNVGSNCTPREYLDLKRRRFQARSGRSASGRRNCNMPSRCIRPERAFRRTHFGFSETTEHLPRIEEVLHYDCRQTHGILSRIHSRLSKVGDAFDVVRAHQFAIAKRKQAWEVVEAPAVDRDRRAEVIDAAAAFRRLRRVSDRYSMRSLTVMAIR